MIWHFRFNFWQTTSTKWLTWVFIRPVAVVHPDLCKSVGNKRPMKKQFVYISIIYHVITAYRKTKYLAFKTRFSTESKSCIRKVWSGIVCTMKCCTLFCPYYLPVAKLWSSLTGCFQRYTGGQNQISSNGSFESAQLSAHLIPVY